MNNPKPAIYTIGYSPHSLEDFIGILHQYSIGALVDVRSVPYSSYRREFNYDNLKQVLPANDIYYVFLGKELGARYEDKSVYIDGRADYERIASHPLFQEGLSRLRKGMEKFSIVIMCAEKDPLTCHRTILISKHLKPIARVLHILADGSVEHHEDTEMRLLKLYGLDGAGQNGEQRTIEEMLEQAYIKQGHKTAYCLKK